MILNTNILLSLDETGFYSFLIRIEIFCLGQIYYEHNNNKFMPSAKFREREDDEKEEEEEGDARENLKLSCIVIDQFLSHILAKHEMTCGWYETREEW